MNKAGDFEINVGMPYPIWCEVIYKGKTIARCSHKELSDLHYASSKAMKEARSKLSDVDKDEV